MTVGCIDSLKELVITKGMGSNTISSCFIAANHSFIIIINDNSYSTLSKSPKVLYNQGKKKETGMYKFIP